MYSLKALSAAPISSCFQAEESSPKTNTSVPQLQLSERMFFLSPTWSTSLSAKDIDECFLFVRVTRPTCIIVVLWKIFKTKPTCLAGECVLPMEYASWSSCLPAGEENHLQLKANLFRVTVWRGELLSAPPRSGRVGSWLSQAAPVGTSYGPWLSSNSSSAEKGEQLWHV